MYVTMERAQATRGPTPLMSPAGPIPLGRGAWNNKMETHRWAD